ncbi:MAG: Mu-like prophage major head subunit gpT family protein [Dehalococcoidia bacterium]|nr:Mu-like prophage major head subunit gpT family protein [Dehalococcoidia bacterium]
MELLKLVENWDGYRSISEVKKSDNYEAQIKEVLDLLSNAKGLPRHRHEYLLREALTTSDFPYLFGDVLDRQVLASYKAVDPVWKAIVRMGTVPRIYPQVGGYRFAITGGDQHLELVAEKGEYLASERDETRYSCYVRKYGRQFDISWEALINDDLGALKDTPERFARAAIRTEHRLVTGTFAGDEGTHAAGNLYDDATAGEINASVNLLTIANLENALEAMAAFTDANGEPIMNRAKFLVVPPSLEMTARQILTSAVKMWTSGTGATPTAFPMTNVVSQMGLTLIVDPYLPVMDPVAANGLTAWYLFADPADIAAMECDYLVGHERPEICMKASDKVSLGGGEVGPMTGDFGTDNVFYRVRDIFGCNKLDWRATYLGGHAA